MQATDDLKVRQYPGLSTILGTTGIGSRGDIISSTSYEVDGYHWWKIAWANGYTGWSAQNWLKLYRDRPEEDFEGQVVKATGLDGVRLNTRSQPGKDASIRGKYSENAIGEIVDGPVQADAYVWWKVAWPDGNVGWSVQRFLTALGPIEGPDTVDPVITLLGDAYIEVERYAGYSDEGAIAHDNKDGNITDRIDTDGLPISTEHTGLYRVWYNVEDSAGNSADEVERVVKVVEATTPPPQYEKKYLYWDFSLLGRV